MKLGRAPRTARIGRCGDFCAFWECGKAEGGEDCGLIVAGFPMNRGNAVAHYIMYLLTTRPHPSPAGGWSERNFLGKITAVKILQMESQIGRQNPTTIIHPHFHPHPLFYANPPALSEFLTGGSFLSIECLRGKAYNTVRERKPDGVSAAGKYRRFCYVLFRRNL